MPMILPMSSNKASEQAALREDDVELNINSVSSQQQKVAPTTATSLSQRMKVPNCNLSKYKVKKGFYLVAVIACVLVALPASIHHGWRHFRLTHSAPICIHQDRALCGSCMSSSSSSLSVPSKKNPFTHYKNEVKIFGQGVNGSAIEFANLTAVFEKRNIKDWEFELLRHHVGREMVGMGKHHHSHGGHKRGSHGKKKRGDFSNKHDDRDFEGEVEGGDEDEDSKMMKKNRHHHGRHHRHHHGKHHHHHLEPFFAFKAGSLESCVAGPGAMTQEFLQNASNIDCYIARFESNTTNSTELPKNQSCPYIAGSEGEDAVAAAIEFENRSEEDYHRRHSKKSHHRKHHKSSLRGKGFEAFAFGSCGRSR